MYFSRAARNAGMSGFPRRSSSAPRLVMASVFPLSVRCRQPLPRVRRRFGDPLLQIRILRHHRFAPVAEKPKHGSGDGGIAHRAVRIEHAMHRAPVLRNHEFPDVPAHAGLHVLRKRDIVGIGAPDAADLRVKDGLVHPGRERLRALDVGANLSARLHVVVKRQHVHRVPQRLHARHERASDGDRRLLVEFVQQSGDVSGDLEAPVHALFRRGRPVRLIEGVPEGESRLIAGGAH